MDMVHCTLAVLHGIQPVFLGHLPEGVLRTDPFSFCPME